jgi:hypothetical protein
MTLQQCRKIATFLPPNSDFVRATRTNTVPSTKELLMAMGAEKIDAIDASNFENAEIIHDLNEPTSEELLAQYDAVVDTGTLEHVFNIAGAFKNAMNALKVGGNLFATLPANDWCGHGFYQFSPEFCYRAFSTENGFRTVKVLVAPVHIAGKWMDGPVYEVLDPAILGSRVEIASRVNTVLLVQAQKIAQVDVFSHWPQQSDYVTMWSQKANMVNADFSLFSRLSSNFWYLISRLTGIYRVLERIRQGCIWNVLCARNPALKRHHWRTSDPDGGGKR